MPEAVTAGWSENKEGHGARVLEGYLGILNAGTKYGETDGKTVINKVGYSEFHILKFRTYNRNINSQRRFDARSEYISLALLSFGDKFSQSKLAVLHSLSTFLHVCLSSSESSPSTQNDDYLNKPLDTWFMRYSFSSLEEYLSFDEIFRPESQSRSTRRTRRVWKEKGGSRDDVGEDFTQCFPLCGSTSGQTWNWNDLSNLKDVFDQESSQSTRTDFVSVSLDNRILTTDAEVSRLQNLARTLHSTFIETFLDCAPSVFPPSSSPAETELQLVLSVVRIARCLYQYIIQSSQDVSLLIPR